MQQKGSSQSDRLPRYWGLIPAAGVGLRMGASLPKQFLKIKGKTLIEWTVLAFAKPERIDGLYIGVASVERYGEWIKSIHCKVLDVFQGGETRADTVLNGCRYILESGGAETDWLLVHDANRPLLTVADVDRLIDAVDDDQAGGIVSLPVFDTLKSGLDGHIEKTIDREQCYRAQTPQMFKLGLLHEALSRCLKDRVSITDESHAVELLGHHPRLVAGNAMNIKITTPSDLKLVETMIGNIGMEES